MDLLSLGVGVCVTIVGDVIVQLLRKGYVSLANLSKENLIRGTWVSEYEEGGKIYNETITVRQVGRNIYATAVLTEKGKPIEKQNIKGTYKNQILTAEYWSTEKNVIERGTLTLRRATHEKLEGYFTFFSGDPLKLQQSAYIWKIMK
jgi:hypothetical protein